MKYTDVLQIIISRLGDNYQDSDQDVLKSIWDEVILNADNISNRTINTSSTNDDASTIEDENLKILSPEIIVATIIAYQNRGVESVKSKSELGESNTFVDYTEKLRNDIIKNGKRILKWVNNWLD